MKALKRDVAEALHSSSASLIIGFYWLYRLRALYQKASVWGFTGTQKQAQTPVLWGWVIGTIISELSQTYHDEEPQNIDAPSTAAPEACFSLPLDLNMFCHTYMQKEVAPNKFYYPPTTLKRNLSLPGHNAVQFNKTPRNSRRLRLMGQAEHENSLPDGW